jgi:hypothetical protein
MSSRLQNCVQEEGVLGSDVKCYLWALKWFSSCSNIAFHLGDTTF